MSKKLTINSKEIFKAVQTVGTLIKGNHTLPILDNILIEFQNQKMVLTADNLEVRSRIEIPIEPNFPNVAICVPFKLLSNILKGFPNTPIEMIFDKMTLKIVTETGNYTIPLVDASEFPASKEAEAKDTITVDATSLIDGLKKALLFTEKTNITNFYNVLIAITPDGTKIASTDGNVIFEYSLPSAGLTSDLTISRSVASYIVQTLSAGEEVELSYSDSFIFLSLAGKQINGILSNAGFPAYAKVFDSLSPDKKLTIDNSIIAPAIKRLYALTDHQNQAVKFSIKENLVELSFINQLQKYEAKETLPCEYIGEPIDIIFNANYINNMLTAIEESIEMNITDKTKPCLFIAENIRAIVGPIKQD
jgi:DNA polymerase-3 subunit beta